MSGAMFKSRQVYRFLHTYRKGNYMKLLKLNLTLVALGLFLLDGSAFAATQSVTANMAFDAAVTLNKTADIDFGTVQSLASGTYTIDTNGVVSASNGGMIIGGLPSAASITVSGSATQTVAISTSSYSADNGVSVSEATCSYNNGAAVSCDAGLVGQTAPGAGKTLKVGVKADVDGTQAAGTSAAPTFVLTVVYG